MNKCKLIQEAAEHHRRSRRLWKLAQSSTDAALARAFWSERRKLQRLERKLARAESN